MAAVLGDCVGGEFEGAEEVPIENVLQHLNNLDDEIKGNGPCRFISMGAKPNTRLPGNIEDMAPL